MAQYETILIHREGKICKITLNRPESLNAFGGPMREELLNALENAADDERIRAVVLTGHGKAFCSGGDINFMTALKERNAPFEDFFPLLNMGIQVVTTIRAMPKPVVACVNGAAAGAGLNLALACDFRVASSEAKFGESFVKIGLHPDWGGTYFLRQLVGDSKALELMMTGDPIDAPEALRIGLVNKVVPHDSLESQTYLFTRKLTDAPATAISGMKKWLWELQKEPLKQAMEWEIEAARACWDSPDSLEGLKAFLEKRPAVFGGSRRTGL